MRNGWNNSNPDPSPLYVLVGKVEFTVARRLG
jgi:hypothetical protein